MAKFITVEGIEGAGKSSCIRFLRDYLEAHGTPPVICTREPGGTPLAEDIRHLVLQPREEPVEPYCELLLMYAARVQHVARVIKPALEAGKWVISDRFSDATMAYQGAGRGLSIERILELDHWALGGFAPDCTLVLDVDVELGLHRASGRSAPDRFEREQTAFFERVRRHYLETAQANAERYWIIDGRRSPREVKAQLETVLGRLLS